MHYLTAVGSAVLVEQARNRQLTAAADESGLLRDELDEYKAKVQYFIYFFVLKKIV